ncbi:c-type cytochrome [Ramlibacter sp. MAHUQ-53]|uniref:c-type cytochrome n=1 Tax=unclassified Ramlibacter TaxID=2617605 RepID=UPI00363092C3
MHKQAALMVVALAAALPALAADKMPLGEKLAREKQCMGCHDVQKDAAGPSFEKIAAKWKGNKDAVRTMVKTIRMGSEAAGGPHWGVAKMPNDAERPQVSEAEARQLANWIQNQKPKK